MSALRAKGPIYFGPFEVTSQVFLTTPHSFALVNLKPILPGHVLVCPRAPRPRLTDLTAPEAADLMLAVQRVQRMLARHYFAAAAAAAPEAGSFNIAVQDGRGAGQTVPHLHVHVLPRIPPSTGTGTGTGTTGSDGPDGDRVYRSLAAEEGNVGGGLWDALHRRPEPTGRFSAVDDAERRPRPAEEMEGEAELYRAVLRDMGGDDD